MNDSRRREIRKAIGILETARSNIESVKDDEEWAFDSLPDGFKESSRGEKMEETVEDLDSALDSLDEIIDLLKGVLL